MAVDAMFIRNSQKYEEVVVYDHDTLNSVFCKNRVYNRNFLYHSILLIVIFCMAVKFV